MAKKSDGTIRTKFQIDGEAEYKKSIGNINSELKTLSSEMKEVESRYEKNEKSMARFKEQGEVLNKQLETQQKKINTLKDAVANSTKAYDNAVDVYNKMVAEFGEQSKEAKRAADNVDKAKNSIEYFTIQLNNTQADFNKTEKAIKNNAQAISDFEKEINDLREKELSELAEDLEKIRNAELDSVVPKTLKERLKDASEQVKQLEENFRKVIAPANGVVTAVGQIAASAGALGATTLGTALTSGAMALSTYATEAAGVAAGIIANTEKFNKATSTLTSSLGLSAEETQKYGEIIKSVYINNFGDGFEDIANTVGLVKQQLSDISDEELQKVVESGYLLRDVYGIDISESIRGANALTKQFGITAEEAYNLIAQGAENGLNQNADLADQIAEYATYYDNLGLSAQDAFNIMAAGAQNGVYQIDKVNDAVKEFSIRAIDGSKTTAEGFAAIGLNAEEMAAIFAEGGEASAAAFTDVINKLAAMDDKVVQDAAGVALFGTQWEDLGAEAVLALGNMGNSIDMTRDKIAEMGETQYYSLSEALTRALKSIEIGDELKTIESKIAKQIPNLTKALNGMFDPETAEESEREFKRIIRDLSEDIGRDIEGMLPTFLNAINGITSSVIEILPQSVMTLLPYLIDGLTQLITDLVRQMPTLLPELAQGAVDLFMGIIGGFNTVIAELTPLLPGIISDITDILVDNLPMMIRTSYQLFIGLINGLVTATPEILKAVGELATTAADEITKGENLNALIQSGIDLVVAIAEGLPQALPQLISALGMVISELLNAEVGYEDMGKIGLSLSEALLNSFGSALGAIDSILGTKTQEIFNTLQSWGAALGDWLYQVKNADLLSAQENRLENSAIDSDIIRVSNQYMREGMSPEEALEKAKAEILDTASKQNYFDLRLKNRLTVDEATKRFSVLKATGQIGNPDYYDNSVFVYANKEKVENAQHTEEEIAKTIEREAEKYSDTLNKEVEAVEESYDKQIAALRNRSAAQKSAGEDYLNNLKENQAEELAEFKETSEKILDTLEKRQTAELGILESAHNTKLALYNKEYMEQLKITDEERYNAIKAIDDEILAINAKTEAEEKASAELEKQQRLNELTQKVYSAGNVEERAKAEKELADYKAEMERAAVLEERELRIAELENRKADINMEYDAKIKAINADYEKRVEKENEAFEIQSENLKLSQESEKAALEEKIAAEKAALEESHQAALDALSTENEQAISYINEQRDAKIKAIQEEKEAAVKAIEEQNAKDVESYKETLRAKAEAGEDIGYITLPYSQTAAYYEQMGKAALAEKEFNNTANTAVSSVATTATGHKNSTHTEVIFNNYSPKALSAHEQIMQNSRQAQVAAIYTGK